MFLQENLQSFVKHAAAAWLEGRASDDAKLAGSADHAKRLVEPAAFISRHSLTPSSPVLSDEAEDYQQRLAELASAANSVLNTAATAHLLPLQATQNGPDEPTHGSHWFRSNDKAQGVDGAFLIDLEQLVDLSAAEAGKEVAMQAASYLAYAPAFLSEVRTARELLDKQFGFFQPLMKLNEVSIVTEDGTPWLLADFWMLDENLCVRRTRRMAPCAKSLAEQTRTAAQLHDRRLAIWHLRSRTGASLFVDGCAAAVMAWSGITLPDVLKSLVDAPWLALELKANDTLAANATLYIEDCILTAHIVGARDEWQLRGTELLASDARSCAECMKNAGMLEVRTEALDAICPHFEDRDHASQELIERKPPHVGAGALYCVG